MSTSLPTTAPLSVRETVVLLDSSLVNMVRHFQEAGYALWLGSGISFGRVKRLPEMIRDTLSFLQKNVVAGKSDCRFRVALLKALKLVLIDAELATIDLDQPTSTWPILGVLVDRLTTKYADLFDITVDGEEDDFLLWHGVHVVEAFADPMIEPDSEHLCIVILALEGLLPEIMTANWDGLIEKAARQLTGTDTLINVCVLPEDVRRVGFRVQLFKFHGCAVLAASDEAKYRAHLIARKSQLDGWEKEHPVTAQRLVNIITSRATLMMGLSVQDANIRSAFVSARENLNWPWPGPFPAIVFSQSELGGDQVVLLKDVYHKSWNPMNRDQIKAESLIPTFAKQLLLALVLQTLCAKLNALVNAAESGLSAVERTQLQRGLLVLKNLLADAGSTNHYDFVRALVQHNSRILGLFRNGSIPSDPQIYNPLTMSPAAHIPLEPGTQASGLPEFAVAIATLGLGVQRGLWTLRAADVVDPSTGAIEIRTSIRSVPVFFASTAESALQLFASGTVSPTGYSVVIHSKTIVEPKPRSPARFVGRTGATSPKAVSVSTLLGEVSTAVELVQRFQGEVAL
jgi:hypothetical protein